MSSISAGTTSTTTLVHSGDTTGSLVFKTNDTGSGGTTAVTIDTSQNVTCVGNITLNNGAADGAQLTLNSAGYSAWNWDNYSGRLRAYYNATEYFTIDTSGNVGIGTSSPSYKLQVTQAGQTNAYIYNSTNAVGLRLIADSSVAYIQTQTNHPLDFATNNGATAMRIRTDGAVLIGTTVEPTSVYNGFKADVNYTIISAASTTCLYVNRNTTTGEIVQIRYNNAGVGSISTNGSTTTYGTSSDYRLKENIAPMTGALATVAQLKPVTYKWKSTGEESQGFIAHELAEVVPDCVTGEKDATEVVDIKDEKGNVIGQETKPKYQNIDTSFLVATLTAALQETKALIDQQAETINALTARVVNLESK